MAEEIINGLSHLPGLRVAARSSAFSFRGKDVEMSEIGRKLGVEHLLEGSVRKARNRIRVTTHLVKVSDGFQVWSGRIERCERLQAARRMLGDEVRTVALDIGDEMGTSAMFSELDAVDHVFITAGTLLFDPKLAPDAKSVRPALDTRFWGAFNAAKFAAVAKMSTGGSITFMSGTAAIRPIHGRSICPIFGCRPRAHQSQRHSAGPDRYTLPRHLRRPPQ